MGQSSHPKSQNITREWTSLSACRAKLLLQINAQVLFSSDKSPMGGLPGGRILSNLRYITGWHLLLPVSWWNEYGICNCYSIVMGFVWSSTIRCSMWIIICGANCALIGLFNLLYAWCHLSLTLFPSLSWYNWQWLYLLLTPQTYNLYW